MLETLADQPLTTPRLEPERPLVEHRASSFAAPAAQTPYFNTDPDLWKNQLPPRPADVEENATRLKIGNYQDNNPASSGIRACFTAVGTTSSFMAGLLLFFRASDERLRSENPYARVMTKVLEKFELGKKYFLEANFSPGAKVANTIFLFTTGTLLGLEVLRTVAQANVNGISTSLAAHGATLLMLSAFTTNNIMIAKASWQCGVTKPLSKTDILCGTGAAIGLLCLAASTYLAVSAGAAAALPYAITGITAAICVRTLGTWSLFKHTLDQLSALKQSDNSHKANIPPPGAYHLYTVGTVLALFASDWNMTSSALPLAMMLQNISSSTFLEWAKRKQEQIRQAIR